MLLVEAMQTLINTKSGVNLIRKKRERRQINKPLNNITSVVKANSLKLLMEKAIKMQKMMERKFKMSTETLRVRLSNNLTYKK